MEQQFKKAQMITIAMMVCVFIMGVVAFMISDRHGYGASSEAKMNFLRLIVYVVSFTQIIMASAIKKIMSVGTGASSKDKKLFTAQVIANVLCEAVAIFGFAILLISKTFMDYVIFALISIVAFVLFFPKRSDWLKWEAA